MFLVVTQLDRPVNGCVVVDWCVCAERSDPDGSASSHCRRNANPTH